MGTYPPFPLASSYSRFFIIFLITFAAFLHQLNAFCIHRVSPVPVVYTSFPSLNLSYGFHNERLSWTEARSKCRLEGARLAVIDTYAKALYIEELKPHWTQVWVGISRESRGSPWLTDDSSTIISYLPWAPGQPTCFNNCIAIRNRNLGVSNEYCNAWKAFICEKPISLSINPRFGGE